MRIALLLTAIVLLQTGCEPTPQEAVETSVTKIGAVVDWRDFKAMIPGELGPFERVAWEGENSGALGIRIAKIKGSYESGANTMKLTVVDLGTIKSAAMKGLDLLDAEIDKENVEGIQKTREWNGHPGYIATDHQRAIGVAVVADRFIVSAEVKGNLATPATLEDVFDDLPLRRLARMDQASR